MLASTSGASAPSRALLALHARSGHNRIMSSVANATASATRADLEALPDDVMGEIIDGVLYTFPRPRPRHAYVQTTLASDLDAFQRGRPGGWWILVEPGLDLEGSPESRP